MKQAKENFEKELIILKQNVSDYEKTLIKYLNPPKKSNYKKMDF